MVNTQPVISAGIQITLRDQARKEQWQHDQEQYQMDRATVIGGKRMARLVAAENYIRLASYEARIREAEIGRDGSRGPARARWTAHLILLRWERDRFIDDSYGPGATLTTDLFSKVDKAEDIPKILDAAYQNLVRQLAREEIIAQIETALTGHSVLKQVDLGELMNALRVALASLQDQGNIQLTGAGVRDAIFGVLKANKRRLPAAIWLRVVYP